MREREYPHTHTKKKDLINEEEILKKKNSI